MSDRFDDGDEGHFVHGGETGLRIITDHGTYVLSFTWTWEAFLFGFMLFGRGIHVCCGPFGIMWRREG